MVCPATACGTPGSAATWREANTSAAGPGAGPGTKICCTPGCWTPGSITTVCGCIVVVGTAGCPWTTTCWTPGSIMTVCGCIVDAGTAGCPWTTTCWVPGCPRTTTCCGGPPATNCGAPATTCGAPSAGTPTSTGTGTEEDAAGCAACAACT